MNISVTSSFSAIDADVLAYIAQVGPSKRADVYRSLNVHRNTFARAEARLLAAGKLQRSGHSLRLPDGVEPPFGGRASTEKPSNINDLDWDRTSDLRIRNPPLYPTELRGRANERTRCLTANTASWDADQCRIRAPFLSTTSCTALFESGGVR